MKFSYGLIKKLLPRVPVPQKLADAINMYAFEVESVDGDTLDIKLYANRYSDSASHIGIAREAAAILGLQFKSPVREIVNLPTDQGLFSARLDEPQLCRRYGARYFEVKKIGDSPAWIKRVLKSCGLRPVNAVVDLMNYVMLETGQPLHAFDFDKLNGGKMIVRRGKHGEKIETLDGQRFVLDQDILVIADAEGPVAIGGIKGGQNSGVHKNTKRILVEAANFDAANIYKTSRRLGLRTDAAVRFSNGLSPTLVEWGLDRATELLTAMGAELKDSRDLYPKPAGDEVIEFDLQKYESLIGASISPLKAKTYFTRLGFSIKPSRNKDRFLVRVPAWRMDLEQPEDLAEEIIRLTGENRLKPEAPFISLASVGQEDSVVLKDKARDILTSFQVDEVYNSSFVGSEDIHEGSKKISIVKPDAPPVELLNPIAEDKKYLRPNLASLLVNNVKDNSRFYDKVRIFEVGKVFTVSEDGVKEKLSLGIALGSKNEPRVILEMKGLVDDFLKSVGLQDFYIRDDGAFLRVESDHHVVARMELVSLPKKIFAAIAEIDLDHIIEIVEGEREFRPLPKYPSVMRDLSVLVAKDVRIGDVIQIIQDVDSDLIDDVDLLDEWVDERLAGKQSVTFRIVFQAEDRTLTDSEVNKDIDKIMNALKRNFAAEIR